MNNIRIRAAGILVRGAEILLVRHEKDGRSYWLLPGGGVDYGETAGEALCREFREEVGLEIRVGRLVLVHDSVPPDRHRQVLNLTFLVEAEPGEVKPGPDGVLKEARFHPWAALPGLTVFPDVKKELLEGLKSAWNSPAIYLGNRWDD